MCQNIDFSHRSREVENRWSKPSQDFPIHSTRHLCIHSSSSTHLSIPTSVHSNIPTEFSNNSTRTHSSFISHTSHKPRLWNTSLHLFPLLYLSAQSSVLRELYTRARDALYNLYYFFSFSISDPSHILQPLASLKSPST